MYRRRLKKAHCFMPMELQFFAESGNGDGGSDGSGSVDGAAGPEETGMTFDDFLKGEGNQAEFDRRVQKAVNTAVSNAQKKWQTMTDDKLSEAERLAQMNKAEKAEYMAAKREKELTDREQAITKKELMAEAKNTLAEKKLPAGLSAVLNYSDAESCQKSIAAVEEAFKSAVQSAVEDRLKGKEPMKKAPGEEQNTLQKQIEAIMLRK
ncbi:MAG: DUF4355 domain-containing protein [Eubacteriales bacterium]|nr:DUF4355 domain-containing protein [Eubacteriales bacterium]